MNKKVGRNDPCPCGSGKKYKACCWGKEEKKTYTATGKRKFKAKVLSTVEKSGALFETAAQSAQTPATQSEAATMESLKFRMGNKDFRKKESDQEEVPEPEPTDLPEEHMPKHKPGDDFKPVDE